MPIKKLITAGRPYSRNSDRSQNLSSHKTIDRSPVKNIDRSPVKNIDRSPVKTIDRSPVKIIDRAPTPDPDSYLDLYPMVKSEDKRSFTYQLYKNNMGFNSNQVLSKTIQVDINIYKTVSDIQNLIASELHIKNSELIIENQTPQTQLINIPNNYIFQISIKNFCPNLDFYLPNGNLIQVKDGYQMTFDQIINSLQNGDIHYSRLCMINNFRITVSGKELNQADFPYYCSQTNTKFNIELKGEYVTLKYGKNEFTFSENENTNNAINLIQQSFKRQARGSYYSYTTVNNKTVTILNGQNRIINDRNEVLKPFINYTVQVDCNFNFNYKREGSNTNLTLDYFSTVFDAQTQIAVKFCYNNGQMIDIYNINQNTNMNQQDVYKVKRNRKMDLYEPEPVLNTGQQYRQLKPENIIIYDARGNKIENLDELLINIQNEGTKFSYDVTFDEKEMLKHETKEILPDEKHESDESVPDEKHESEEIISDMDDDPEAEHLGFDSDSDSKIEKKSVISSPISVDKSMSPKSRIKISRIRPTIKPLNPDQKEKEKKKMIKDEEDEDEDDESSKKSKEKLNVRFIFESSNSKKIKPFNKKLPIKMTISDIKLMLTEDYDIEDKINIKYKDKKIKVTIDDDMNLEDVKEETEETTSDDELINVLYVQLVPLKRSKSQGYIKKTEEDTTDDFKIQILTQSQIDQFTQQNELGKGATSKVIKVNRVYALKIFNSEFYKRDDDDDSDTKETEIDYEKLKLFRKEYDIINKLNHPNIIKAFGFCYGDKENRPSILLEFCPYTLSSTIKTLNKKERIRIILEIIEGMKHVHAAGIIHRDLKPSNILLDKNKHVKLSDFGISRIMNDEELTHSMTEYVGTRSFMAPELIQGRTNYTNKIDVYAFGVVVFMIFTKGNYPKINLFDVGLGKKAKIPSYISKKANKLINDCWETDPDERPSFDDLGDFVLANKDQIYAEN